MDSFSKEMGKVVVFVTLVALVLVGLLMLNGCSTVNGLATDFESGGRLMREATQKSVDAQRRTRIRKAYAERDDELAKAAEMILQQAN